MNTIKIFKLALVSLLMAGFSVSCNQSAKNNRNEKSSGIDSMEVMGINNARHDEIRGRTQSEMERVRMRLNSLDENDPDFNGKLNQELDRFNADMDSINAHLANNNFETSDDYRSRYDSVRIKSNELKNKLERWTDKTSENLEELEDEIKTEFRELKEFLKNDKN
ncbi:hypothetical protein [Sunxiuqinia indica]|uniref:hypothetical protein n=1 Tax=Sunxiuqinia indica TaxID=2692584 RepID=UPI00135C67F3|nr:hypothetical protein [Sunxiuqinia indica]